MIVSNASAQTTETLVLQEKDYLETAFVKVIHDDRIHGIEVINFTHNCMYIQPYIQDVSLFPYNTPISIKIDGEIMGYLNVPGPLSTIPDVRLCDPINIFWRNITFGLESTTIMLQDNSTENINDVYVNEFQSSTNYGDNTGLYDLRTDNNRDKLNAIGFNLSSIPSGSSVTEAILSIWMQTEGIDAGESWNTDAHHVYNQTWDEMSITYDNFFDFNYNATYSDRWVVSGPTPTPDELNWVNWTVTYSVDYEVQASNENVSFMLIGDLNSGSPAAADMLSFFSKENADTTKRPILYVTYEPPEAPANCWYEDPGEIRIPPGCEYPMNLLEGWAPP